MSILRPRSPSFRTARKYSQCFSIQIRMNASDNANILHVSIHINRETKVNPPLDTGFFCILWILQLSIYPAGEFISISSVESWLDIYKMEWNRFFQPNRYSLCMAVSDRIYSIRCDR